MQNYIFLSKPLTRKKAIFKGKNFAFLLKHSRLSRTEKYFNFANTPYRQEPSKRVDKRRKILANLICFTLIFSIRHPEGFCWGSPPCLKKAQFIVPKKLGTKIIPSVSKRKN